jgi:glycolate dehydrogenase FAD-binding subunit
MIAALETAQTELAGIVGAARVVADSESCAKLSIEAQAPKLVVYPSSAEQVAEVLRYAAAQGLALIACRNATKLGIGNPPRRYDVAMSLKDLNQIWHYEPSDLTVTVEPGMKFADFQRFVGRERLWLPLDPSAAARATLGGILATNSSGPLRLHYGTARDMVLGMRIATTDGKLIKTGGRVVKNVAGYDLSKLLIGSFGSLGVIVEASLKLFPLPARRATFILAAKTLDVARTIRRTIMRSPISLMRMVLLDESAARLTTESAQSSGEVNGGQIWVEAGGSERVLERSARILGEICAAANSSLQSVAIEESERGWQGIVDFKVGLATKFPQAAILKVSLPVDSSEEFLERAARIIGNTSTAIFAQTAVGILHVCLLGNLPLPEMAVLVEDLRRQAASAGGALVAEHGPAGLKERVDVWGKPGDNFGIMRKLKEAWDPKGILSPGRFIGGL